MAGLEEGDSSSPSHIQNRHNASPRGGLPQGFMALNPGISRGVAFTTEWIAGNLSSAAETQLYPDHRLSAAIEVQRCYLVLVSLPAYPRLCQLLKAATILLA